jgi:hypothetical protein
MPASAPATAGLNAVTSEITAPLILDFLEWLTWDVRPYAEVMDMWRTSCPRLTVWEDAVDGGYVMRKREGSAGAVVEVTPLGRQLLREMRG